MKINKIIGITIITVSILMPIIYFIKLEKDIIKYRNNIVTKIDYHSNYYAILDIPKINLKRELYSICDENNDINKNILVHEKSIFPDSDNSNIILASHSGSGSIAYFKNLYKLKTNDKIYLYYNDYLYEYKIIKIEYQQKTGKLLVNNYKGKMITLITCTKNSNKLQTIYYAKLNNSKKIEKYD